MQLNPLNVRATSLNMPEQASRSSEQIRVREAGSLQTTRGNQRNCNLSFLVKKKVTVVTTWSPALQMLADIASVSPHLCPMLMPPSAKFLSGNTSSPQISQVPFIKSLWHMKHCSITTPFHGVRLYACSVMVMAGRETTLEELICCVLGALIHEGIVPKIANDLYCCTNSPEGLIPTGNKYSRSYSIATSKSLLPKTVINPTSTTGACKV